MGWFTENPNAVLIVIGVVVLVIANLPAGPFASLWSWLTRFAGSFGGDKIADEDEAKLVVDLIAIRRRLESADHPKAANSVTDAIIDVLEGGAGE